MSSNNGKVILLRGVSGSGKSTQVCKLRQQFELGDKFDFEKCSADDFFIQDGAYNFDASKLSQAHNVCFGKFLNAIRNRVKVIVVDNTFIRIWELDNYVRAAVQSGYIVEIVEIKLETISDMKLCAARNIHKVPPEVVARMAMDFETAEGVYNVPAIQVKFIPLVRQA